MLANKLMSAALSGGAVDKLYVDDVFSTYLYTGNGSTQTITNGIDLAGKGGLVWTKCRNSSGNHALIDTVRGGDLAHYTNLINGHGSVPAMTFTGTGYNTCPFNLGDMNGNGGLYSSHTFRRAPKFFDVVTYTGDGASSRAIAHLLGQEVGMVMTKSTSTTGAWNTYHRSATGDLALNTTAAQTGSKALVNSATATTFTVSGAANTNAVTYVAYLFAHDPSADGIIQCGSFTTDASGNATVNLGWEPQFVLHKRADTASDWVLLDAMRGFAVTDPASRLFPNTSGAELAVAGNIKPNSTGFYANGVGVAASATYIYLAICRPNKPPTTGTEVYNAIARTGTGAVATVTGVGFAPDLVMTSSRNYPSYAGHVGQFWDRLRGAGNYLRTTSIAVEGNVDNAGVLTMDGVSVSATSGGQNDSSDPFINHFFRRAPGFFDVVCYTGTGAARTVPHGFGVAPELMIVRNRGNYAWSVWHKDLGGANSLELNTNAAKGAYGDGFDSSVPTSTAITMPDGGRGVNGSAETYVAYLFASLPGISKIGSYTGNGTTQTINCGFTTGARFILIKRTDSTGDWYVWDTARGIISANDPHLSLNSSAAEETTNDSVDPDVSGFIVNQVAATNINVSGGQYIFLSIA